MLYLFILILIFGDQYLLFNEELFIILAFFCLCYIVKTNLGGLVETELYDRKNKVIHAYVEFLNKKLNFFNNDIKNNQIRLNYISNFGILQQYYYEIFSDFISELLNQSTLDYKKKLESNFIIYFAGLVSKKRKFLI